MKSQILVNTNPTETRIAILEDDKLVELFVEREKQQSLVGNIYKGVVDRVLPSINAAFINIGLKRNAFLHVSDLVETADGVSSYLDIVDENSTNHKKVSRPTLIQDILQRKQELLVQVTKDPFEGKGPRVTTNISLPGRFLVLVPRGSTKGVSRKIVIKSERRRLRELVKELCPPDMGLIVRTAAEDTDRNAFVSDTEYLTNLWNDIDSRFEKSKAPALINQELSVAIQMLRDVVRPNIDAIWVEDRELFRQITNYLKSVIPHLKDRLNLYKGPGTLFNEYKIEPQIEKIFEPKVWLKES